MYDIICIMMTLLLEVLAMSLHFPSLGKTIEYDAIFLRPPRLGKKDRLGVGMMHGIVSA